MDVLILEDDQTLAQVFFDALDGAGHDATVVNSNADAISQLFRRKFDLLICDLMIYGQTSIPVLEYANFACPDAEIILVTGSGLFPRGELHYWVSDVSYRIQKPVKIDDLLLLVSHYERTRAERADPGPAELSA